MIVGLAGAVGGIATDQLWLLVLALVVLILGGLGAWLIASRTRKSTSTRVRAERDIVAAGEGSEIAVTRGQPLNGTDVRLRAGRDLKATGGGKIGSSQSGPPDSSKEAG